MSFEKISINRIIFLVKTATLGTIIVAAFFVLYSPSFASAQPDPSAQLDPFAQPDLFAKLGPSAQPDPSAQLDPFAQPDPSAQLGPSAQPDLFAKPDPQLIAIAQSDLSLTTSHPAFAQTDSTFPPSSQLDPTLLSTERILDWQSDIIINADTSLSVTETIKVNALHNEINHGIYRDFPTVYWDALGFVDAVGFKVISVTRDGLIEPYSLEKQKNGVRIYIGDPYQSVFMGEHTYVITYNTTEQLGYFKKYDELYYNITGNGWMFPIDVARASIRLPLGVRPEAVSTGGYTGPSGSKTGLFTSSVEQSDGYVYAKFETTTMLNPYEGFSVYVDWPKGFVPVPSAISKIQDFAWDNSPAIVGFACAMGLLLYYLAVWYFFGRDPSGSAIYPRFELSKDLSPARARILKIMSNDTKAMTAALVNLAVKGYLRIVEKKVLFSSTYTVEKTKPADGISANKSLADASLSEEEQSLLTNLFAVSDSFSFSNAYYTQVQGVTNAFNSIMKSFSKGKIIGNMKFIVGGVFLSLGGVLAIVMTGVVVHGENHVVSLFPVSIIVGIPMLIVGIVFQSIQKNRLSNILGCLVQFGCLFPFAIAFLVVMLGATKDLLDKSISVYELVSCMFLFVVHFFFLNAMKARTIEGRKYYEEVAGLEMFIRATEKEKLKLVGKKLPLTFSTYEKFLPFAIALDLEQLWATQFSRQIKEAMATPETHPVWYTGSSFSSTGFSSNLSSAMSSSIASSSAPPGSSSGGGGGGGGSGGGGGGGGGGGW